MFSWFFGLLSIVIWLYQVALLIYVILSWVSPTKTVFSQQLARFVEPLLILLRRWMAKILPANWLRVDWSPLVAFLLIEILRSIFASLR